MSRTPPLGAVVPTGAEARYREVEQRLWLDEPVRSAAIIHDFLRVGGAGDPGGATG